MTLQIAQGRSVFSIVFALAVLGGILLFRSNGPEETIATPEGNEGLSGVSTVGLGQILPSGILEAPLSPALFPIRKWEVEEIEIEAKAAIAADETATRIYYQRNRLERLPFASLTKLMSAMVAVEQIPPETVVKVSKQAVATEGDKGGLIVGEELLRNDIVKILLIESSNDAAAALAQVVGVPLFVSRMNEKSRELGLAQTHFTNVTGLDGPNHYSTAEDLSKLAAASFRYPLIWEILGMKEAEVVSVDGKFRHHLVSTNELLGEVPEVIGGKTGYTGEAGGSMILVSKLDNQKVITVVLGATNRFQESRRLLDWLKRAYIWK